MSGREQKIKEHDADFILIKKFLKNDEKAFNELVLKYKDKIFNLCYRILGDYEEANDCAQECFIKVFKSLGSFKFESGFSTWLYRIAVNTCKNEMGSLGHRIRRKALSFDNHGSGDSERSEAGFLQSYSGDSASDPSSLFERKEEGLLIQNAVDSLKKNGKVLVVLRDIEGRSYEDISEITGMNIGTVKSNLARARQELRDKLRGII